MNFRKLLTYIIALAAIALPLNGDEITIGPGSKKLPVKGESFVLNGMNAFVIQPQKPAKNKPWVWYAPTLPKHPDRAEIWMFERFLASGVAIAGIDVGESYGSPDGRAGFQQLYEYLVEKRKFAHKPCLLARSRGGLMLYNWAVEHPDCVAAVAGIYPVCNIASYPGVAKAAPAYNMTADELEKQLKEHNPIDRLGPLAKAKVPIMHLHGDSDRVVPLELNSKPLVDRYREAGGDPKLVIVPQGGHDLKPHWFKSEDLTEFVIQHASAAAATEK